MKLQESEFAFFLPFFNEDFRRSADYRAFRRAAFRAGALPTDAAERDATLLELIHTARLLKKKKRAAVASLPLVDKLLRFRREIKPFLVRVAPNVTYTRAWFQSTLCDRLLHEAMSKAFTHLHRRNYLGENRHVYGVYLQRLASYLFVKAVHTIPETPSKNGSDDGHADDDVSYSDSD